MKRILSTISLAVAVMLLSQISASAQEPLVHYCSHCAFYQGEFTIKNDTGITLHYQVRWGNKSQWEKITLKNGSTMKHSYPIGYIRDKAVPTPYIKYDRIGGDAIYTNQEYPIKFHAVQTSSGRNRSTTGPKRYYFEFATNGRNLNLYAIPGQN